jgi:hypothetical protein
MWQAFSRDNGSRSGRSAGLITPPGFAGCRLLRVLLLVGVLVLIHQVGEDLVYVARSHLDSWQVQHRGWLLYAIGFALYALLLSLPFVPGVELGWALMMLLGVEGVIGAYLATLAGLSLSYAVGNRIPLEVIARLLRWLHLFRAAAWLGRLEPLDAAQGLDLLIARAPARIVPHLLRHRYLALVVAFNLPGNILLGGGGGIGLLAGLSRLFTLPKYLLTVCLAVAPVPLLMLVYHNLLTG